MNLAQNIKMLRKEKNLTQKELGEKLNIPFRTIMNWERGIRQPSSQNMVLLENFFGVSGAFLRGETNKRAPMEKWEDPELMESMDQSVDFMLSNIGKLISKQSERTRTDYYRFFVEFQRILNYDFEIQGCILDILINCLSASSRLVDTAWEMKGCGVYEMDPKYQYLSKREFNEILNALQTISSFIEYE